MMCHRWIGNTSERASERNSDSATLSNELMNAMNAPDAMPGTSTGNTTSRNVNQPLAPRHLELAIEEEPGLGNGGLGRLAACYLDSLATLEIPAIGYGIRYEFGIFHQDIRDGSQVELTDKWLHWGNPWEFVRPDVSFYVAFGGHTKNEIDAQGRFVVRWIPAHQVKGVACDMPILGDRVNTCNALRLWKSEAVESFDLQDFNAGDYYEAVQEKVISETLSKVLYPNDEPEAGKRLRLAQQYFFVSCSLQDMLRLLDRRREPVEHFANMFTAQLNDTHPSIAVAELMRLLVDERLVPWDEAWDITRRTFAYTNHTLLPEALETWGVPLFQSLLPRPLEIIYEINRRFLDEVRQRHPGDDARGARMSLIDERGEKRVRMAHLSTIGSHAVNSVGELAERDSSAIATGVVGDLDLCVAGTAQQVSPQRRAAAQFDGRHDLQLPQAQRHRASPYWPWARKMSATSSMGYYTAPTLLGGRTLRRTGNFAQQVGGHLHVLEMCCSAFHLPARR
ncbi:glycogen/starch/alpha-glucan phosphorylase-like protein [Paraburkholderia sp. UCT70]